MSLLNPNSPEVLAKKIHQIIAMAGDGKLADDSSCAREWRDFLHKVEADKLFEYVDSCLEEAFESSGFALQDLVNELGRRLDYEVTDGRYKGTRGKIGQDGIWESADRQVVIVEVKTTDTYRIDLNKIAKYKTELVKNGTVAECASILLVVGRDDTGGLEAQIRGSRHAWEIRIISAKALCKLVALKIQSEEPETTKKIHSVFRPIEYTRLDELIDIVFTTAQDVDSAAEEQEALDSQSMETSQHKTQKHTPAEIMADVRKRAARALGTREKVSLVASKRTQFVNDDKTIRTVILTSKVHSDQRPDHNRLWFSLSPQHFKFLKEAEKGFLVLAGVNQNLCHVIGMADLKGILPKLNETPDGYRYIAIIIKPGNKFELRGPNITLDLTRHTLKLE